MTTTEPSFAPDVTDELKAELSALGVRINASKYGHYFNCKDGSCELGNHNQIPKAFVQLLIDIVKADVKDWWAMTDEEERSWDAKVIAEATTGEWKWDISEAGYNDGIVCDGITHVLTATTNEDIRIAKPDMDFIIRAQKRWPLCIAENDKLRGLIDADNGRLLAASKRVWGDTHWWGCDTAEHLADEVLALRAQVAELEKQKSELRAMLTEKEHRDAQ